jgi:hypothetical protein
MEQDRAKENLIRAGELLMYTIWLQCQMSDLIIFKDNPSLIQDFVANPKKVPSAVSEKRIAYWEKQFHQVKKEFIEKFRDLLTDTDIKDLEGIFHTRNMIAHAHISMGRDYMLYRPSGGPRKEQALVGALDLKPVDDQADPMILKLEFWRDDVYLNLFNRIKRIDEVCFERLSGSIGIPHSRIR